MPEFSLKTELEKNAKSIIATTKKKIDEMYGNITMTGDVIIPEGGDVKQFYYLNNTEASLNITLGGSKQIIVNQSNGSMISAVERVFQVPPKSSVEIFYADDVWLVTYPFVVGDISITEDVIQTAYNAI